MKCKKCGKELNNLNHYFIPQQKREKSYRLCIECAKKDNIITLV